MSRLIIYNIFFYISLLCLFCKKNVGPASTTLDRHWSSTGFASSHTRLAAPEVCWSIMNTKWCTGVVSVLVHRLRYWPSFGTTLGRHVVLRSLIRNVIHTVVSCMCICIFLMTVRISCWLIISLSLPFSNTVISCVKLQMFRQYVCTCSLPS